MKKLFRVTVQFRSVGAFRYMRTVCDVEALEIRLAADMVESKFFRHCPTIVKIEELSSE